MYDATGRDNLHHRQEERREPGGAIRCAVHIIGQPLELAGVFVFAPQRLDHAHALDVFVVCAGNL
jgi:hypothetical protein